MAKKKKKRKKSSSSQRSSLKSLLLLLLIAGGLWYLIQHADSSSVISEVTRSDRAHIEKAELACTPAGRPSQILYRTGYATSYNRQWKLPNWVSYELLRNETQGEVSRSDRFVSDPDVKGTPADTRDYTRSGYDRGHMAPAGDMKWSEQAMDESFLLSNICPQAPGLNRGRWKELEELVREWAQRDSALIVACGPIVSDSPRTIGRNRIAVPDRYYKVVAAPYVDPPRGIAFLFDNSDEQPRMRALAVTIDSVEKLTGIDFFYNLPDSIETPIESKLWIETWNLN